MLYQFDDLTKMIDPKSKSRIIKKVFAGNTDDYDYFIEQLEKIDSWEDAYKYIDNEFSKRNININDNRLAVAFTDIVFKKYYPLYHF